MATSLKSILDEPVAQLGIREAHALLEVAQAELASHRAMLEQAEEDVSRHERMGEDALAAQQWAARARKRIERAEGMVRMCLDSKARHERKAAP